MTPPERPKLSREIAQGYFAPYGGFNFDKYPLYTMAIRGYYERSMGDPKKNDIGIYDDAFFIATRDTFHTYNANTDPARLKRGSKTSKGTATLVPGLYLSHSLDLHQGRYPALCQRKDVVKVWRYKEDGTRWTDTGMFGINIHSGGIRSTNSEGCETIPPMQYGDFLKVVIDTIGEYGWNGIVVPHLLIEY